MSTNAKALFFFLAEARSYGGARKKLGYEYASHAVRVAAARLIGEGA